jgi:hypothetical protein
MPWRFVSPLSPGISYHLMIDIVSVNSILYVLRLQDFKLRVSLGSLRQVEPTSQPATPAPLTLLFFWCSSYVKMGGFDTTIGMLHTNPSHHH